MLLHGWLQNKKSWGQIAEELPKSFTCWFLDLPAFGENNLILQDKSPLGYAQWLDNFISKNRIHNCFVLGHSFGGRIAAISATRNKEIKKLVLCCAPIVKNDTPITKIISILGKLGIKNIPFVSDVFRSDDYKNTTSVNRKIFLEAVGFDLKNYLPKIKIPTLILAGEKDPEVPMSVSESANKTIKGSEFYVFPNSGHFVHLEKPLLFEAKVKAFLLE